MRQQTDKDPRTPPCVVSVAREHPADRGASLGPIATPSVRRQLVNRSTPRGDGLIKRHERPTIFYCPISINLRKASGPFAILDVVRAHRGTERST